MKRDRDKQKSKKSARGKWIMELCGTIGGHKRCAKKQDTTANEMHTTTVYLVEKAYRLLFKYLIQFRFFSICHFQP